MKTYAIEVDGLPLEIVQDDDGAFIIPDGWRGIGSAVKPSFEPILLARKPLSESSIARNVLVHGTGAINVDGCRIATAETIASHYGTGGGAGHTTGKWREKYQPGDAGKITQSAGRFPANILHDGSEEVLDLFPETAPASSGEFKRRATLGVRSNVNIAGRREEIAGIGYGDTGSAARFFPTLDYGPEDIPRGLYCPKAGKADRAGSKHPTVKPQKLMRWLCRLVTPPGGTVLDPFAGSGATLKAATSEGFNAIGCDITDEWIAEMERRFGVDAERASDVADLAAALR